METSQADLSLIPHQILALYKDARILEANKHLELLESQIFSTDKHDETLLKGLREDYVSKKPFYDAVKKEASEVRSLLKSFATTHLDWEQMIEDAKGTKVFWKPSKDSPIHTLRLDGKFQLPVFNVLAVLLEVDMYSTWVPTIMGMGMKYLRVLSDIDRFKKLVTTGIALPWPIANRDANIYGYGVDLLDQGRILAVVRSYEHAPAVPETVQWQNFEETKHLVVDHAEQSTAANKSTTSTGSNTLNKATTSSSSSTSKSPASNNPEASPSTSTAQAPQDNIESDSNPNNNIDQFVNLIKSLDSLVPKIPSGYVRAAVQQGGFLLTPITHNETEVSFLFEIDPKLAVVPSWLINWGLKHFAFAMFGLLESVASKVGTETSAYTRRMAEKADVYEFLQKRFDEYLNSTPEERERRTQESLALSRVPEPQEASPSDN